MFLGNLKSKVVLRDQNHTPIGAIALQRTNVELETVNLIKLGSKKYTDKSGEPVIHIVNECPKYVKAHFSKSF